METERYREILGKELRVTDRQMKEQAIQKLKEFEEQRKNGPTELETAMRYGAKQTTRWVPLCSSVQARVPTKLSSLTRGVLLLDLQEAESEQKVPSYLSQRDRRGLQPGMG